MFTKIRQKLAERKGRKEYPDPTPVEMAVKFRRPPTLQEQIRQMVRSERLAQEAQRMGADTFEEFDDFDVGDDFDPTSPYETVFDPDLGKDVTRPEKEYLDAHRKQFDDHVRQAKKNASKSKFKEEKPVARTESKDSAAPTKSEK